MDNLTKIIFTLFGILVILVGIFYFVFQQATPTGEVIVEDKYTYTKAICNHENFCQDYEVTCDNGEVVRVKPITGAAVQNPKSWVDERENKSEIVCE